MNITKNKNIIEEKPKDLVQSYLNAIDDKNKNEIRQLTIQNDKNDIEKDIVYELYSNNQLNNERLLFIIENCTSYLNISSCLITKLMKDNNKNLLEIIFKKHLKFFDNEMIIKLLDYFKNKMPISISDFNEQINNNKYKVSTELNKNFEKYDSSYYLFNACKLGNASMVKYLVEYGANINEEDSNCETPLFNACINGYENIVKYLVKHGADVNKRKKDGWTPLFNACSSRNGNKYFTICKIFSGTWSRCK